MKCLFFETSAKLNAYLLIQRCWNECKSTHYVLPPLSLYTCLVNLNIHPLNGQNSFVWIIVFFLIYEPTDAFNPNFEAKMNIKSKKLKWTNQREIEKKNHFPN